MRKIASFFLIALLAFQASLASAVPITDSRRAVSFLRTADTNGYTANDVLGEATGSSAAIQFKNVPRGAQGTFLTSAKLEIDLSAVTSGMTSFNLYCYNVTPPSALGDNAAWDLPAGDRASFLFGVSLGTPVDLGSTLFVGTDGINKQFMPENSSIYCYLVTVGAYTPASGTRYVITLSFVGFD